MPIRNLEEIASNYLKKDFIIHLIPLIPLQLLNLNGFEQHLYFIKCMRSLRCSSIFDITRFMNMYKQYTKARVDNIIENDPILANNINYDVIGISRLIIYGKVFQMIKLTVIIFNICYFLGFIWFILVMIFMDRAGVSHARLSEEETIKENTDNFIVYFET